MTQDKSTDVERVTWLASGDPCRQPRGRRLASVYRRDATNTQCAAQAPYVVQLVPMVYDCHYSLFSIGFPLISQRILWGPISFRFMVGAITQQSALIYLPASNPESNEEFAYSEKPSLQHKFVKHNPPTVHAAHRNS
jgi:hypothetical protein